MASKRSLRVSAALVLRIPCRRFASYEMLVNLRPRSDNAIRLAPVGSIPRLEKGQFDRG